jgi:SAM-dependent methyltransferase
VSWAAVRQAYSTLRTAESDGAPLDGAWAAYRAAVEDTAERPPFHLRILLETLENVAKSHGIARDKVAILDHGCGGGLTVLYLIARGYHGACGVDLGHNGHIEPLNKILRRVGIAEQHFYNYDGLRLPFADGRFDLIFSQQVLEHVSAPYFEAYYSEEARVLKPAGVVLHQVPHRLVPYDSHTRTWLIHYFPKSARRLLYPLSGNDPDYVEAILALRWPWVHSRKMRQVFGNHRNITLRRLAVTRDFDKPGEAVFEGSTRLRKLIDLVSNAPVLRGVAGPIIANLVMTESLAINESKNARGQGDQP